ncbi:MAG: hypothetical protein ACRDYD_03200, partial [Acidimicrobiales bacterium]
GDQERGEQDPGGGDGGRGRLEELVAAAAAATGPPEAALAAIGSPPAAITPELVTVGAQAEVASFGGADRGSAAPRPPAQAVIEVGGAYGPRSMDAPSIEALGVVARSALLPDPEGVAEVELVVLHRDPPEPGGSPSAGSPTGDLPPRGSSAADPPSSGEGQRSGTRASSGSSVELPRRPAGGTPRTNADRNALMRELRDL